LRAAGRTYPISRHAEIYKWIKCFLYSSAANRACRNWFYYCETYENGTVVAQTGREVGHGCPRSLALLRWRSDPKRYSEGNADVSTDCPETDRGGAGPRDCHDTSASQDRRMPHSRRRKLKAKLTYSPLRCSRTLRRNGSNGCHNRLYRVVESLKWCYLYRAVDSTGATLDFLL
jgi:hypothetical protein